jgi:hypothetical protein
LNLEKINLAVLGLCLCALSLKAGMNQFEVMNGIMPLYFAISAAAVFLAIKGSRIARAVMYLLLCFHTLALYYPQFYARIYPNNNLEEDLGWAVYDKFSVGILFLLALGITLLLWFLNRFVWKQNSLWICDLITASLLATDLISGVLGINNLSYGFNMSHLIKSGIWILSFFIFWILSRKCTASFSKARLAFLAAAILFSPAAFFGILWAVDENQKLVLEEYQGEDFSYFAIVQKKGGGSGLINERGQEVIPCVVESFYEDHAYPGTHLFRLYETTGDYMINERGKILCDEYTGYDFLEKEDLILVSKSVHGQRKYGAINPEGREVIPLQYDTKDQLIEAENIDISTDGTNEDSFEENNLSVIESGEKEGVVNTDNEIILPAEYDAVALTDNGYILADRYELIDDEVVKLQSLLDQNGTVLIPPARQTINPQNENGWIQVENSDDGIYFLDKNLKKVLDLGTQYEWAGEFHRVSR